VLQFVAFFETSTYTCLQSDNGFYFPALNQEKQDDFLPFDGVSNIVQVGFKEMQRSLPFHSPTPDICRCFLDWRLAFGFLLLLSQEQNGTDPFFFVSF
jgi:hypothetical protein